MLQRRSLLHSRARRLFRRCAQSVSPANRAEAHECAKWTIAILLLLALLPMCFDALVPYDTIHIVIRRRQQRDTATLAGGAFVASVNEEIAALPTVPRASSNDGVRTLRTRIEMRKGVFGAVAPVEELHGRGRTRRRQSGGLAVNVLPCNEVSRPS